MTDDLVNEKRVSKEPGEEILAAKCENPQEPYICFKFRHSPQVQKLVEKFLVKNYILSKQLGLMIMIYEQRIRYYVTQKPDEWGIWYELKKILNLSVFKKLCLYYALDYEFDLPNGRLRFLDPPKELKKKYYQRIST
ncbi:hypothetical protein RF11_07160 [Thelohanellus kitauei]|uniref:Uncharacterized protein n=1 Tax=Thelohanellus kitauei TaxID=669202 RepID=A0A0C2N1F9_THEKT|nr:hypothetical protein RF11_07160 [Thelohanellus kitauei]